MQGLLRPVPLASSTAASSRTADPCPFHSYSSSPGLPSTHPHPPTHTLQVSTADGDCIQIAYSTNATAGGVLNATSTVMLRGCFSPHSSTNRAWRKAKPAIYSDLYKQCQTKIADGLPPGNGTHLWCPRCVGWGDSVGVSGPSGVLTCGRMVAALAEWPSAAAGCCMLPPRPLLATAPPTPRPNPPSHPGPACSSNVAASTMRIRLFEKCPEGDDFKYCAYGQSKGFFQVIDDDALPSWMLACIGCFACIGPLILATFLLWEYKFKKA